MNIDKESNYLIFGTKSYDPNSVYCRVAAEKLRETCLTLRRNDGVSAVELWVAMSAVMSNLLKSNKSDPAKIIAFREMNIDLCRDLDTRHHTFVAHICLATIKTAADGSKSILKNEPESFRISDRNLGVPIEDHISASDIPEDLVGAHVYKTKIPDDPFVAFPVKEAAKTKAGTNEN